MKVKASRVVNAVGILKSLDLTKMKLSTAYSVRMRLNEFQSVMEDFETRRLELAKTHGTMSEDKTHYEFTEEGSKEAFQESMQTMLDDELEMNIKPIPIALLDEYIEIEPINVELISWFISGLEQA